MATIKHLPAKSTVKCRKELLAEVDCRILELILNEFDRVYNEHIQVNERMVDGLPILSGELTTTMDALNYCIQPMYCDKGIDIHIKTCYQYLNRFIPKSLGIDIFNKALEDITVYYLKHPLGVQNGKELFPKWTSMIVTVMATIAREEFSLTDYVFIEDTGMLAFEAYSRSKYIRGSIDLNAIYNGYKIWWDKCYIHSS